MTEHKFLKGKPRPMCLMGAFFYKMCGKFASRKGESACKAACDKITSRLNAVCAQECIYAEKLLQTTRSRASEALSTLRFSAEPEVHEASSSAGAAEIRAIRRMNAASAQTANSIAVARNGIICSCEYITSIDTVLEERIEKLRRRVYAKLHAYASGVRSGLFRHPGIADFEIVETACPALGIYHANHHQLDSKIRHFAYNEKEVD